jgi:hypothetical protein
LAGRNAEARPVLDSLVAEGYALDRLMGIAGVAAARVGDTARAQALSRALDTLPTARKFGDAIYARATIAAALGQRDEAVRLLQQAIGIGVPYYFGIHVFATIHVDDADPLLASLNGYAPFEQLIRAKDR